MMTLFWVVFTALAVSFTCSILEAVLLSVTRSYAGVLKERDPRAGAWLQAMQDRLDEPIAAILTLNTIAHTAGAALGGAVALQVFGETWITLFSAGLTLVILLFSEILPKTIGASYWQGLARPATYVLRAMMWVMKPVIVPLSAFNRMVSPSGGNATISRAEIEILAEIGRREGVLEEDEWKVVSNVIRLDEVTIAEVMTPRTDMVAVPLDASLEEAMDVMLEEGHLRLPIHDGGLDHIVGVVLARDLWQAHRDGARNIQAIARPPYFAPASKAVDDLIPEMRRRRNKMAIVLDEFGGTAGLVTLEDLIEEIIGEIQDEHEGDEPEAFHRLDDGFVRVWGGVPVRDVGERLGLDLPDEHHDTLGGWIFGELGRVGSVGDEVEVRGGRFRIARMRGRRVEYLTFHAAAPGHEEG